MPDSELFEGAEYLSESNRVNRGRGGRRASRGCVRELHKADRR
jgi:hypothetical protein